MLKEILYDKADWPDGVWKDEPDKLVWKDKKTGLDCMIVRNTIGCLCGYVGVTPEHPLFGANYDTPTVSVHGGLTYAAGCEGHICHPSDGEDHVWWFGFDCGHSYDIVPRMNKPWMKTGSYKTIRFVKSEIESLAQQLIGLAG